jgi:hypothetical protein
VLLIGCVAGKVFLVDSHPVVEKACGEKTGVAIFSEDMRLNAMSLFPNGL